jgi:hypothetical protein
MATATLQIVSGRAKRNVPSRLAESHEHDLALWESEGGALSPCEPFYASDSFEIPRRRAPASPPLLKSPKPEMRFHLRQAAELAVKAGMSYRETVDLLRVFLIDTAIRSKGGVKKDAAALLGLTRDHVREFHKRGKEIF